MKPVQHVSFLHSSHLNPFKTHVYIQVQSMWPLSNGENMRNPCIFHTGDALQTCGDSRDICTPRNWGLEGRNQMRLIDGLGCIENTPSREIMRQKCISALASHDTVSFRRQGPHGHSSFQLKLSCRPTYSQSGPAVNYTVVVFLCSLQMQNEVPLVLRWTWELWFLVEWF